MPAYSDILVQAFIEALKRWEQVEDNWFYVELPLPTGNIEVAAELVVDIPLKTLVLFDLAIYPKSSKEVIPGNASLVRVFKEAMADLKAVASQFGYHLVVLIGQRVTNSSSSNPGRHIMIRL
ncbi:hypothetical protein [Herbaspirillum huttiense]|uniref:hypothetical protein n=1 Tax=Herbaspirillum huttiense TaxID=863372 RepID=UPI002176AEEF|nr:hypothetical protein [Herbaspirillum huttiense]UWE14309.1 hypothetical protein NY669_14375 [Herbaspirillum huttiense]